MITFTPAISIFCSTLVNTRKKIPNFIEKTVEGLANVWLISFPLEKAKSAQDRKDLNITGSFLGDSGGFQLIQKRRHGSIKMSLDHVTPSNVLTWLEANCQRGMNLDLPPVFDSADMYDNEFNNCLNESIVNFDYFTKNRKSKELKLYNVLHGRNIDYMKQWYEGVKKFKFESWAFGIRSFSPSTQIGALLFLYDALKKDGDDLANYDLHILGKSSPEISMALTYFNVFCKSPLVSYDSSRFSCGSRYRLMLEELLSGKMHGFLKGVNAVEDTNDQHQDYVDFRTAGYKVPCNCKVCSSWNTYAVDNKVSEQIGIAAVSNVIDLHNLLLMQKMVDRCNTMLMNPTYFKRTVDRICRSDMSKYNSLYIALQMINMYFINGVSFDKIEKIYHNNILEFTDDAYVEEGQLADISEDNEEDVDNLFS